MKTRSIAPSLLLILSYVAPVAAQKHTPKAHPAPAPAPVAAPAPAPAPAPAAASPKSQAQTDLGTSQDRPWARLASPPEQKIALDMFREGNGLLKESLFVQAAAKYREALAHWDHPGIHYNLALALLNLDQPVEVFMQLEEAMKYGVAPLDSDKFEHAGRYKALIQQQLAHVEVTCTKSKWAGAVIAMDGKTLFTAPGRYEARVRVGKHTLTAEKHGFVTTQQHPMLFAGQKATIDLQLFTAEDLTQYRRKWPVAIPYVTLVAGIVIAGGGALMHWQASESFKAYDKGINDCGGCIPSATLVGQKSTGNTFQTVAFVGYGLGGFVAILGGVLAYVNRAQAFRVNPDKEKDKAISSFQLVPSLGPSGGGLSASFNF